MSEEDLVIGKIKTISIDDSSVIVEVETDKPLYPYGGEVGILDYFSEIHPCILKLQKTRVGKTCIYEMIELTKILRSCGDQGLMNIIGTDVLVLTPGSKKLQDVLESGKINEEGIFDSFRGYETVFLGRKFMTR